MPNPPTIDTGEYQLKNGSIKLRGTCRAGSNLTVTVDVNGMGQAQNVTCGGDDTWEADVSIPQAGDYPAHVKDDFGHDDQTVTVVD